ncbi:sulfatase modifying factor 1 [Klebsiella pneumoniae]|nr:sulfatase modifying factor 1 [Klebsiella pneumoniae]
MRKLIVVASVAASLLLGCDQKSTDKRETLSETLVAKSLSNMVPVKGGEFLMGDFGPLVGETPVSYTHLDVYKRQLLVAPEQ